MIDREALLEAIEKQLISLSVGGCTCGTKSPQVSWHAAGCHYRKSEEILENVEELRTALASQEGAQAGEVRPAGYMRKEDVGKRSFWVSDNKSTYYTMPVYTTPPAPDEAVRVADWRCVPIEPTHEMYRAGENWSHTHYGKSWPRDTLRGCYRAMVLHGPRARKGGGA